MNKKVYTESVRKSARRLFAEGWTDEEIIKEIACGPTAARIIRETYKEGGDYENTTPKPVQ